MIVFCIVDDISTYANNEIKNTIKNIADYTVSNLICKGYDVKVGKNEDSLLREVANKYQYAVVMSPGTEYINGFAFFEALEKLIKQDFFVAGHVLDRTMHDAYYELHHQCYVINMQHYKLLGNPIIGFFEKDSPHRQFKPARSKSNWHDDYTPRVVAPGIQEEHYKHKCHGWNLLKLAFENNLPVIVFDEDIRNNKKHYYPESPKDFNECKKYIEYKLDYCENQFVHTDNTEWTMGITEKFEQVIIPASGLLYLDNIDTGKVIFYDYNQRALDYWAKNIKRNNHISYKFVKTNLLEDIDLVKHIDSNLKTLVNLSNIFSYEGTAAKYSLKHRIQAQERLIGALNEKIKNVFVTFTHQADARIFDIVTWH